MRAAAACQQSCTIIIRENHFENLRDWVVVDSNKSKRLARSSVPETFAPFIRIIIIDIYSVQMKMPTVTRLHEELLADRYRPNSIYANDDELRFKWGFSRVTLH